MTDVIYRRKKDISIRSIDGGITVLVHMEDRVHEMKVEVDVGLPKMKILDIRGHMIRIPHEECGKALEALPRAVGLEIKRGLSVLMEETIGGSIGCTHMTNLVMEACYCSIQGQYAAFRETFPALGDDLTPEERMKLFMTMRPDMINSCALYSNDSELVKRARKLPMSENIQKLIDRVVSFYKAG
ncbi:MAG: DUF2889 domain-containing protein [Deltaproteobacteria bacterium]|nr:DUF2889 domain-containing protein [Candidatus Zymogenaceae bacterium]